MTVAEVAAYLRVHRITIYRLVVKGVLHPFKVGRVLRINRSEMVPCCTTEIAFDCSSAPQPKIDNVTRGRS